jgi:hypothetical protein
MVETRRQVRPYPLALLLLTMLNGPAMTADNSFQDSGVVELRQYTLHGGKRDTLVEIFERNFIESQNAVGAYVLGQFRDLDDPDRFVWLRGFKDMETRKTALEAFYGGEVWRANRSAANATMLDSDNVLLLRPMAKHPVPAPPVTARKQPVYRVAMHQLAGVAPGDFATLFASRIAPRVDNAGGIVLMTLASLDSANNFPALPVREHESLFVWIARFDDAGSEAHFTAQMKAETGWRDGVENRVLPALMRKPEVLRLAPTSRSGLD